MPPADEQHHTSPGRRAAAIVTPFVAALMATLAAYLLLRHVLPDRMATHFGFDGADRYDPSGSALASYLVVFVIEAVLFLVWALAGDEDDTPASFRTIVTLAWAVATATAYLLCALLQASTKSPDGRDVTVPLPQFLIALAIGAAIALIGRFLPRRH
ncbi:DUF1648 domain-containing protein [Streptomyces sp. SID5910]|uniref:DUF1648 domain-containing protein n=1 Tax=Streptomyces sp. SID5910 TaxID=2690312 RepID=UPI00136C22DE|nr:DUF1648 domain-containing protein [Streptomyces sp. SID5910]MYR46121.1 DUF1648 domain-containing protein [Streptomyces sp. SID5910]